EGIAIEKRDVRVPSGSERTDSIIYAKNLCGTGRHRAQSLLHAKSIGGGNTGFEEQNAILRNVAFVASHQCNRNSSSLENCRILEGRIGGLQGLKPLHDWTK